MKKLSKIFGILLVLASVFTVTGCPPKEPDEPTQFTDGKIIVKNEAGFGIYMELVGINPENYDNGNAIYANRKIVKRSTVIKNGQYAVLDYDASKFEGCTATIMYSKDNYTWYWPTYIYKSMSFQTTTTITVTHDGERFQAKHTYTPFEFKIPAGVEPAILPIKNNSDQTLWVQMVKWDSAKADPYNFSWDNSYKAGSAKVKLLPSESHNFEFYWTDDDYDRIGTVIAGNEVIGCWCNQWRNAPSGLNLDFDPEANNGDGEIKFNYIYNDTSASVFEVECNANNRDAVVCFE